MFFEAVKFEDFSNGSEKMEATSGVMFLHQNTSRKQQQLTNLK